MLVVLVVLGSAFAAFEYDVPRRLGWTEAEAPESVEPPEGLALPALPAVPPVAVPLESGAADPQAVRRALRGLRRDSDLGRHTVFAVGSPDGTVLFDDNGGTAIPASTIKLLTGMAALEAIGPRHRFVTRVVRGARPRDLVLVGGGDPYLARETPARATYPRRADLETLATRTAEALLSEGRTRVRLGYDDSLFTGPVASPHWESDYLPDDVVSPITALWADEGRREDAPGYEADPSRAAAGAFAAALRRAGITVAGAPRPALAGEASADVASVESPPLWQVVDRVLDVSDNEGAEVLAHHVGLVEGFGGSFAGGARGVRAVLTRLDVPLVGAVIRDGSGLSRRNRLRADTLLAVMARAADPAHPDLRTILTGLPVAGFSGSLAARFDESAPAGLGRVRAKTATLTGVHGLAGVTTDRDGNLMTFVLLTDRVRVEDTLDARATLDALAAALAACHCS